MSQNNVIEVVYSETPKYGIPYSEIKKLCYGVRKYEFSKHFYSVSPSVLNVFPEKDFYFERDYETDSYFFISKKEAKKTFKTLADKGIDCVLEKFCLRKIGKGEFEYGHLDHGFYEEGYPKWIDAYSNDYGFMNELQGLLKQRKEESNV